MIKKLLEDLSELNDLKEEFNQKISPSKYSDEKLKSIDGKSTFEITEMLRERFLFADTWEQAVIGIDWLGIKDVNSVSTNKKLLEQVNMRIEDYEDSIVANSPMAKLSLFGIDLDDGAEIYLLWDKSPEPQVIIYTGYSEFIYTDLKEFLEKWSKV